MRAILAASILSLLLSACVAGAAIRAGTTAAKANDQVDCSAVARELQTMNIDRMKKIDILQACTNVNLMDQDQADRDFAAGAHALRDGAAVWQPPVYTRPRAIYCASAGDGGFVCQ